MVWIKWRNLHLARGLYMDDSAQGPGCWRTFWSVPIIIPSIFHSSFTLIKVLLLKLVFSTTILSLCKGGGRGAIYGLDPRFGFSGNCGTLRTQSPSAQVCYSDPSFSDTFWDKFTQNCPSWPVWNRFFFNQIVTQDTTGYIINIGLPSIHIFFAVGGVFQQDRNGFSLNTPGYSCHTKLSTMVGAKREIKKQTNKLRKHTV